MVIYVAVLPFGLNILPFVPSTFQLNNIFTSIANHTMAKRDSYIYLPSLKSRWFKKHRLTNYGKNSIMRVCKVPILPLLLILILPICCCSEEEEPSYIGKWVLNRMEPSLGESYLGSYIHIKADKSFILYDNNNGRLVRGMPEHFMLRELKLTLTDPEDGEKYFFIILGLKDEKLTLRTAIWGDEVVLYLIKEVY